VSYAPGLYFQTFLNYVILFIDITAALVIAISALRTIVAFLVLQKKPAKDQTVEKEAIKMFLVSSLIIGIDLEVGSDVLRTILVPSIVDLLALAVIVVLRVLLNWSLTK